MCYCRRGLVEIQHCRHLHKISLNCTHTNLFTSTGSVLSHRLLPTLYLAAGITVSYHHAFLMYNFMMITSPRSILRRARRKGPISYNGTPQIHPKLTLPFDNHHPHLIHPYQAQPHSPPQMASGFNQPFCHNTLSGTHTHTQRWSRRQVHNMSAPLAMLIESDTLIITRNPKVIWEEPHHHPQCRE